jgi:hypothetical protein
MFFDKINPKKRILNPIRFLVFNIEQIKETTIDC